MRGTYLLIVAFWWSLSYGFRTILAFNNVVPQLTMPHSFSDSRHMKFPKVHFSLRSQMDADNEETETDGHMVAKRENTIPMKRLLLLLSETPPNQATPKPLTEQILTQVRVLEKSCPTESSQVIRKLAGTWELVWTSQDDSTKEANRGPFSWINPLENQSYSINNSKNIMGQSNPVLPLVIQQGLEAAGVLDTPTTSSASSRPRSLNRPVSTQSIDLKKQLATNVVSLRVWDKFTMSLAVKIGIRPNANDARRIDVQFLSCRVNVPSANVDWDIPLGFGLEGWLRTTYIDDTLRITRGHKGSVFVLTRPGRLT